MVVEFAVVVYSPLYVFLFFMTQFVETVQLTGSLIAFDPFRGTVFCIAFQKEQKMVVLVCAAETDVPETAY